MPKIQKVFTLNVNPQKYLNACSAEELVDLQLLLDKPCYKSLITKALNPNSTK